MVPKKDRWRQKISLMFYLTLVNSDQEAERLSAIIGMYFLCAPLELHIILSSY